MTNQRVLDQLEDRRLSEQEQSTSKKLVDVLRETASRKFSPEAFGQARVSMKEAANLIEGLQRELSAVAGVARCAVAQIYEDVNAQRPRALVEIDEGRLWSFIREVLERGRDIQAQYVGGSQSYEHCSARVDQKARELADKFVAKFGATHEPRAAAVNEPVFYRCAACQEIMLAAHLEGENGHQRIYEDDEGQPCPSVCGPVRPTVLTAGEFINRFLPANWLEDSSLETWFPITAEELQRLKSERASPPPSALRFKVGDQVRPKGWSTTCTIKHVGYMLEGMCFMLDKELQPAETKDESHG